MKTCKICGFEGNEEKFHGRVCMPCKSGIQSRKGTESSRKAMDWQRANPERRREISLKYYYRIRNTVFDHYGWVCKCCGETEPYFLSIDHVNGHGNEHRRELTKRSAGSGAAFYRWITDNGYPDDFQVLCMNCNHGRMRNGGICPHQQGATTIPQGSTLK